MKTKFTLFCIILLINHNSFSQVIVKWRFDATISNPLVISTDLQYDGQNTFLSIQNFDALQSTYLHKLDSGGVVSVIDTMDYMSEECDKRMARGNDGSIYLCGQRDSALQHSKIKIVKTDSLLGVKWTIVPFDTSINDYHSARLAYSGFDNSIYLVCHRSYSNGVSSVIMKIDSAGNILWYNDTLPTLGLNCIRMLVDHESNVRIGGFTYNTGTDEDFTIIGLDANGNNYWRVTTLVQDDDRLEDFTIDDQNNIYAYGFYSNGSRARVLKVLSSGISDWITPVHDMQGIKIAVDTSGIYVAGTDSVTGSKLAIAKLDHSGTLISSTSFSNNVSGIIGAQLNDASDLYVCYNNDSAGQYHWAISKFNSVVSMRWTYLYADSIPSLCYPSAFYLLEDEFIVSGLMSGAISTVRFVETIPLYTSEEDKTSLKYWYDKSSDQLSIENTGNYFDEIYFELFDLKSELILSKRLKDGVQNNIRLADLSSGIYVFSVQCGNRVFRGRFFK